MTDELDAQVLAELKEYVNSMDFSLPGVECFTVANKTFRVLRTTASPTIWIIPVLQETEKPIKIITNEQQEVDFIKGWWDINA
jgi:hypothetical protein